MICLHVSNSHYESGRIINSNDYLKVTKERGNEWVEYLLEQFKPENAPSRLKCVFTFLDLEQALAYGATLNEQVNYYQVDIADEPLRCPMVLCDFIRKS